MDSHVVTGLGVVSPIGEGKHAFWRALADGRHAIRDATRFDVGAYTCRLAAALDDARYRAILEEHADLDPTAALAVVAARHAMRDAGPSLAAVAPDRIALVLGTSTGGITSRSEYELGDPSDRDRRHAMLRRSGYHVQAGAIGDALGIGGPRLGVSTACASSTQAVAHARSLLFGRTVDAVVVGGVDVLVEDVFAGFHAMGAMSASPCAPFSDPPGMTLGEGAAFVVLETASHARRRDVNPLCSVLGIGSSADGWHATAPDPTGAGISLAIAGALADAGLDASAIDYVNVHGTGTEANDTAEWHALERVFGARARVLPMSSTKSFFGHALGAAGMLELVATILALRNGALPPTLHYVGPRGLGPPDPVAGARARPHQFSRALSLSSAFGGANAAVIVGDVRERPVGAETRPRIAVIGRGALRPAHDASPSERVLRVHEPPFSDVVRGVDPRGFDRVTRHLTMASALALRDAGFRDLRGALRRRAGAFIGAPRMSAEAATDYWSTIRDRGFRAASPAAFARVVMNAPAGVVSRALGLLGPHTVMTCGCASALAAIHEAISWLSLSDSADMLVAGAAAELTDAVLEDHAYWDPAGRLPAGESAACVVLDREDRVRARGGTIRAFIAGAAISGPGSVAFADAVRRGSEALGGSPVGCVYIACERDREPDLEIPGVPVVRPARRYGWHEALDALAFVDAVDAIAAGRHASALVVAVDANVGTIAIALTA